MKACLFVMMILSATPSVISQATSPSAANDTYSQNSQRNLTITGCLTRNSHNKYELVDEKGVHNLLYGSVPFDSYVGQSVTLVGARSTTPSTDTGTARPMPLFKVKELRPANGPCTK